MNQLDFEGLEEEANDKLMDVMDILITQMGLKCNHDELVRAVHTIQLFIWQHALQRTGAAVGGWYGDE
jgi:hypothetical protein